MRPPQDPRPESLLAEHRAAALAFARRKYPGLSPADHDDIVQEAMVSVLARLRRGPLVDPVPYLMRVVYTAGAHVLQDRHRETVSLDDHREKLDGAELRVDRSVTPLSPEEHALSRCDDADIARVLRERLTAQERRALALRLIDGRPPAEVAAALNLPPRQYRRLLESGGRKLAAGVALVRDRDGLARVASVVPPSGSADPGLAA
jgi:RNA polymerase sigma factor (sigma-70 family)